MTRKIYLFIVALTITFLQGCEFTNPTDNLALIIDYNIINAVVGINIIDPETSLPIELDESEVITIYLKGDDSEKLIDPVGEYKDSYETNLGLLTLAVNPNYTPSTAEPINVLAEIKCDGYLDAYCPITITAEGLTQATVSLVKLNEPPTGVSVEEFDNITTLSGGVVLANVTLEGSSSGMTVEIPKDMEIRDDSGNVLSGQLSFRQIVFSAFEEESLGLMPGGEGVFATAITEDGTEEEIRFYSAGFFNFELTDASGNTGTTFENGSVNISYELEDDIQNPETGEPAKAGDKISVWSFDEDEQIWQYEHEAEVVEKDGSLFIETELSHFSYWNFDWYGSISRCTTSGATVTCETDNTSENTYVTFHAKYYDLETGEFLRYSHFYGYTNTAENIINAPANTSVLVKFYYASPLWNLPDDVEIENLCSGDYKFYTSKKVETKSVDIHFTAYCKSGDTKVQVIPSYYAYCYSLDGYGNTYFRIEEGEAHLDNLVVGGNYRVYTYYGGRQSMDITYDGTEEYTFELDLPSGVCNNF